VAAEPLGPQEAVTDFGRRRRREERARPEESETTNHWILGDQYGIHFPADARALWDGGTDFLTTAFPTAGVLAADNCVTAIDRCAEVGGGSTGRKLALSVRHRRPEAGLHTELFVKFSRDFDDPFGTAAGPRWRRRCGSPPWRCPTASRSLCRARSSATTTANRAPGS
jgi:hypothetical protein